MKLPVEEVLTDGPWRSVIRDSNRDQSKSRYTLVTILLDPNQARAAELGPDTLLRSKTLELRHQEVDDLMLVHYAFQHLVQNRKYEQLRGPGNLPGAHGLPISGSSRI